MKGRQTDGWFRAVQVLVEERIRQAREEGLFDDLPGKGKPLKLDDDSMVAPHLRASYRILRNAGILPPQMELRREIGHLRELLNETRCEEDARQLVREINEKITASNIMGGFSTVTGMDQLYAEKVVERLKTKRARYLLRRREGERD